MSSLIIPAAGSSTRFPNTRPKWMLTHPSGKMMLTEGLMACPLDKYDKIYVALLRSHIDQYKCIDGLQSEFKALGIADKTTIVVLDNPTKSQPETVTEVIKRCGITGPIFIKDCDSYFKNEFSDKNSICVYHLNKMPSVHAANKSYVTVDDNLIVNNIVEKKVISDIFCCGGYSFSDAVQYVSQFESLREHDNLYTSHIILAMMMSGSAQFTITECEEYIDWGTEKDWIAFKNTFATYFIDLDGVLVYNSAKSFPPYWGTTNKLHHNVNTVNELYESGRAHIVITTSRDKSHRLETLAQLQTHGIKFHDIVFGLPHCQRIVINDYAGTNPYPSCTAINIKRDSDELKGML